MKQFFLQDVKEQLTKIKAKEDRLEELKSWKEKICKKPEIL